MSLTLGELKAIKPLDEDLNLYGHAPEKSPEQYAFRDACIQRFEYSIELAWKTSLKVLGSEVKAAKPAIRDIARNDLISNPELWMEFIEARNFRSHRTVRR